MEHAKSPLGFVSVSIGIACRDAPEQADFNLLLAQADQALYASKGNGRNGATLFAPAGKETGAAANSSMAVAAETAGAMETSGAMQMAGA